jgi:hypothetical protein
MTTQIDRFAAVAERYLNWADAWTGDPEEKMRAALRLLAELHLAAIDLPDTWPDEKHEVEEQSHLPRWKALTEKFRRLPMDGYFQVFNPRETGGERPTRCSLADDLADIYLDLDRGLVLYKKGYVEEAAWEWRFSFWQHWGRHLVHALCALYQFSLDGAASDEALRKSP